VPLLFAASAILEFSVEKGDLVLIDGVAPIKRVALDVYEGDAWAIVEVFVARLKVPIGRRLLAHEKVEVEVNLHLRRAVAEDCNHDYVDHEDDDSADLTQDKWSEVFAKAAFSSGS